MRADDLSERFFAQIDAEIQREQAALERAETWDTARERQGCIKGLRKARMNFVQVWKRYLSEDTDAIEGKVSKH